MSYIIAICKLLWLYATWRLTWTHTPDMIPVVVVHRTVYIFIQPICRKKQINWWYSKYPHAQYSVSTLAVIWPEAHSRHDACVTHARPTDKNSQVNNVNTLQPCSRCMVLWVVYRLLVIRNSLCQCSSTFFGMVHPFSKLIHLTPHNITSP